jgi:type II secretory ATPase GspE/PulE/Tfp pilus assembly ATPase PilB-like protein
MMAQRLIRKVCQHCAEVYEPSDEELAKLNIERSSLKDGFRKGKGCPECFHRGYRGRMGIYEILIMNDHIREQIVEKVNANAIKREAIKRGDMETLRMDGISKIIAGLTTVEEIMRMTQADIY